MPFGDSLIPAPFLADPESTRKARLVVRFGIWGACFAIPYVVFYMAIGHRWGASIVTVCGILFALIPTILRRTGSLHFAANALAGIMIAGFCGLSAIEGGIEGHAVAWLVSIPLCALLLDGQRPALVWSLLCLVAAGIFAGLDIAGYRVPRLYDARWEGIVTGAGYLSLILFMFGLGLIFERSRARAMQAMQAANTELARVNQEKSEFLGIAAHDLKNPLGAVTGFAELIADENPDRPDTREMAERIMEASERMRRLVGDLLDVNAIEEGRIRYEIERCDLSRIVSDVAEGYRHAARTKGIPLVWEPPGPAFLFADARFTGQIVDNLLSNAVKYSPFGRPVVLRVREEERAWTLEVEDRGPGLSAADQGKLFGKFEKLTPQPTGGESSNGLGLSIVRRIAREMGGEVACRSELGSGSVFSVTLPRWGGEANGIEPPPRRDRMGA